VTTKKHPSENDFLFSFGIVTDGRHPEMLKCSILSILDQREVSLNAFEIIIVGSTAAVVQLPDKIRDCITFIEFDESVKPGWITKKKNLISKVAKGQYIVLMHDYFALDPFWLAEIQTILSRKRTLDVVMCNIIDYEGKRYSDWVLHPLNYNLSDIVTFPNFCLLPYRNSRLTRFMYCPGGFFIVRKSFMEQYPLNEDLTWGGGEDVEWSFRWRKNNIIYGVIPSASVRVLKENKKSPFVPITGFRYLILTFFSIPGIRFLVTRIPVDIRLLRRKIGLSDEISW
jgi:hypothetical protein